MCVYVCVYVRGWAGLRLSELQAEICCSVLQCVATRCKFMEACCRVLPCVAVCCSVLPCAAVC